MRKIIVRILATVLVLFAVLWFLQRLLVPKYVENIPEGSMIEEYYDTDKDTDVIFIGDCEVYENISPVTIWEKSGITSYIRGSSDQRIWQSYYLLKDTLEYQTPKVLVLSILSLTEEECESEEYNRLTLDGMKWSETKVEAIKDSMLEEESFVSYLFPLLRYHDRWDQISSEDFKYFFSKPKVTTNGYLMQVGVRGVTSLPRYPALGNYDFSEKTMSYLDKIRELCNEKGIQLCLYKGPSVYPHWYEEWDKQVVDYANKYGLVYINTANLADTIGIDYTKDTFDYGQHLNVEGAEKLSAYIALFLKDTYNLLDHKFDSEQVEKWEELKIRYYEEKEIKLKNWEETKE